MVRWNATDERSKLKVKGIGHATRANIKVAPLANS